MRSGLFCVVSALLAGGCAGDEHDPMDMDAEDHVHDHAHAMVTGQLVSELGAVTKRAAATGRYAAGSTWPGGRAPGPLDVVEIPPGKTVTIDDTTAIAKTLIVRGRLKFSVTATTKLRVETLVVDEGGSLLVGDEGAAVGAGVTATIAIRDDLPVTLDTQRLARGIIAAPTAVVRMVSARPRDPFVTFKGNVGPATAGNLATRAAVPSSWQVNDDVVIPATEFTREWQPDMPAGTRSSTITSSRLKNEIRTISAISRTGAGGITLNEKLSFAHERADATIDEIRVNAANLTRNIVVMSEGTSRDVSHRGHTMFMGHDVKLIGVLFKGMGRTDKRAIVSDPSLPDSVYNAPGVAGAPAGDRFSNPRGRYAVHFHRAGTDGASPAAVVEKCAVIGTPGWGFVNHSSRVNFVDNVAFDFKGAGFVAEDGDEIGEFVGNIAVGGTGNGEFSNQRSVFGNAPRMDQGDMGFMGEGFWFQSPDVAVRNNIAAGCKGSGFFFWTAGRFDPLNGTGHYTGRPLGRALPPGVAPRKWDYNHDRQPDAYNLEDFPLAEFTGNIAYGTFTGLRLRFVNFGAVAILSVRDKDLEKEDLLLADGAAITTQARRARVKITNSTFWNNLNGVHGTYLSEADLSDVTIVAAKPARTTKPSGPVKYIEDAGEGGIGLDFHHNNRDTTLTRVKVKNYATGVWSDMGAGNPGTPSVTTFDTDFVGCTEDFVGAPQEAKGVDLFSQVASTNNTPDDPQ